MSDRPAQPSAQPPLRCAIIGLGRIGSLLEDDTLREKPCTHAGAIAARSDCRLVGGCDIDETRREQFRARWGCTAVYADARAMLAATHPELVVVATHPDTHARFVAMAANAGVGVAVCEKPLADSLRAGRRIRSLVRRGAIRVVVNHERRYSQDYVQARNMIRSGRFGALSAFRGTLCFGASAPHGRVLSHDGTHMLDAIAFLIDRPLRLGRIEGNLRARRGSTYLFARAGDAERRADDDIKGVIEIGSCRDHLVFEIELSLTRGRITIGNGLFRVEESRPSPWYERYRSLLPLPSDEHPAIAETGYFARMMADAVACARDPHRRPLSDVEAGYRALCIIRAARFRLFR